MVYAVVSKTTGYNDHAGSNPTLGTHRFLYVCVKMYVYGRFECRTDPEPVEGVGGGVEWLAKREHVTESHPRHYENYA